MESQDSVLTLIKLVFAVLAVLAVLVFVLVPLIRKLRTAPDMEALMRTYDLEDEPLEELEIPLGGKGSMPDRAGLIQLARDDPKRAAQIVAKWIREKR